MKDRAIEMIESLVRENLELGWSHLEDGHTYMARVHFERALEQVREIETILATRPSQPQQPPLIEL